MAIPIPQVKTALRLGGNCNFRTIHGKWKETLFCIVFWSDLVWETYSTTGRKFWVLNISLWKKSPLKIFISKNIHHKKIHPWKIFTPEQYFSLENIHPWKLVAPEKYWSLRNIHPWKYHFVFVITRCQVFVIFEILECPAFRKYRIQVIFAWFTVNRVEITISTQAEGGFYLRP